MSKCAVGKLLGQEDQTKDSNFTQVQTDLQTVKQKVEETIKFETSNSIYFLYDDLKKRSFDNPWSTS